MKATLVEKQQLNLGVPLVREMDCQAIIGMVYNCMTADIHCQRWLRMIKQFDVTFRYIADKENVMADMLNKV